MDIRISLQCSLCIIDYGGIINENYALEVSDGTHSESFDISDRYQL